MFSKNFAVAYSISSDGMKTAATVDESSQYGAIVGGAHQNHFVSIPFVPNDCTDKDQSKKDFIVETLEKINGSNPSMKTAAEINLATLTFQAKEGSEKNVPFLQ
eukprot:7690764-Ditylum_brightwellii.AAC.1